MNTEATGPKRPLIDGETLEAMGRLTRRAIRTLRQRFAAWRERIADGGEIAWEDGEPVDAPQHNDGR